MQEKKENFSVFEVIHWESWHADFYKGFIRTFMKLKVSWKNK